MSQRLIFRGSRGKRVRGFSSGLSLLIVLALLLGPGLAAKPAAEAALAPNPQEAGALALVMAPAGSVEQLARLAQAGLVVYGATLSSAQASTPWRAAGRRTGAAAGGCIGEGTGRRHDGRCLLPGLSTAAQLRAGQRAALGRIRQGAAGPGRPGAAANDRGRDDTPGGGRGRGRAGDAGAWDRATSDRGRAGGDHAGPSGAGDAEPGDDAGDQRLHGTAQRRGTGNDWRLALHDHQPQHLQRHADPEGWSVCRRAHAEPGAGRGVSRLGQFRHAVDLSQRDRPAHGHERSQRHLHHRRASGQPALERTGLRRGRQR